MPVVTPDQQVNELRQEVETCRSRLREVESDIRDVRRKDRPKDRWDKIEALSGVFAALSGVVAAVVTGAILYLVGYRLTDSVKLALEKDRLHLENVKEMQDILLKLPVANRDEARAAALALASFGEAAVGPLILILDDGQQVPATTAGLRAVGMTNADEVCPSLVNVVANRSRLYRWGTHQVALRLLGELRCDNAKAAVSDYATLLGGIRSDADLPKYRAVVSDTPTLGNIRDLNDDLVRAQASLR